VALDDLGAGYSSLNLLSDLNPDYIKLDLELVQSVGENELQAQLAESLIETARDNGIVTLAEGIETDDEWAWFRDHGVDYLQGYRFSKPLEDPPETIECDSPPESVNAG
jgi:EAL domain-containing protein (putative c-di-GMP-specific phosphodiesterase class I)